MSTDELSLEGAGQWHHARHRTRPDLRGIRIGFNVVDAVERQNGAYRPTRNLPIQFTRPVGNWINDEGYVWPQGKILGKYDRTIYDTGLGKWVYQDDKKKLGVKDIETGEFYAFQNVKTGSAVPLAFADGVNGYSGDIDGFLTPMNGFDTAVQDLYGTEDENLGLMNPVDGSLISSGDNASLRDAGDPTNSTLELVGVAHRDQMRETRNNMYQYQQEIEAIGVVKEAYITVPFVIEGGDLTLDGASAPNYTNSQQRKVSRDQTVLFVEKPELLQTGASIYVDAWGNPLLPDSSGMGTKYQLEFGTIVDFKFEIDIPYADLAQTHPQVEVAGTSTDGLMGEIMYLGRKIKGANVLPKDLADALRSSNRYGWVKIRFDIP